jgi:PAS domain S-box-containing protein
MKAVTKEERRAAYPLVLVFCLLAAGIVTAGMGFLTLLGWVLKLPLLASFGAGLVPMAPSTAVLFLLYGAAICLRARPPLSQRAFRFSVAMVGLGTMVALLLFMLGCLNIHWEIEHIGLNIIYTAGKTLIGHMSPVTAFGFLLASLSFLASLSMSATRPWRTVLALGAASLLAGTSFIFLLAYIYGMPFLYGATILPPALNSVLTFVILGFALLALAGRTTGLVGGMHGDGSRTTLAFALIFVLLAGGIVAVGFRYYRNYERQFRAEAERQLSTVAELKVVELAQWRKERLGDGAIVFKNNAFTALVRRFFEQPEDAEAQRQLRSWIEKYHGSYGYDRIRLLDSQGIPRMSWPAGNLSPMSSTIQKNLPEILRSGRVTFQDFYRNNYDQRVYLTVMAPILDESDTNRPLGVLDLRIDPETYLYPFIKRWPTPSLPAETLLVRREGNDALCLNELKFRTNTALRLHFSLENTNAAAVKAVLGQKGIVEARDALGAPVLAALYAVPDSPWYLVTRMDTAKVYAPLGERLRLTLLIVSLLLISAGLGIGVIWRHQRVRFYRERAETAEALRASEIRYRRLFEAARDGILILDAGTGMIVDVNPFLIEMLGFSHEQFLGKKLWELGFFKDIIANQANLEELQRKEYLRYEDLPLETADGRRIEVEFVSNVYLVNHQKVIQCNIRDITERKQAEDQLKHALADLERSNKELEQFAYVASHDLQEPLRMVSSYTQLLVKRFEGQLDDKTKKYVHYVVDGAIRMQTLINDLLAYSRVGTRGQPLEPTDAHAALGEAIRNLAALIEENRAIITNADLPTVRADALQLGMVFQNLLANAIKFRREDIPRIHVSAQDQSREWVFAVKDNGIGIEPQHAERVFVLFQRLHTQAEYPGTGIGLAVCKRIVERHGGKIWFESEPGNGSTFFFTVPK